MKSGDTFGDYAVLRRLGKGGMGEVWLLQSTTGVRVAAKILDVETARDHEARRRFVREAQLALGVRHPNLVEVYDVGEDPETGLCYILMEYVDGGTLADLLARKGALAVEDAVTVVNAIANVLELGRRKGIVHRDIKPSNIMFRTDGTPKLADLGIARGGSSGAEMTTVTQTGALIGTPAYMAPEQMLDAHAVDTRADIYSLGVVFFEMLTGERPNKNDTVVQLMAKAVCGEPLPDVRTLRPEVSASLAQLLNMMVMPDRERRISTPGQITSALEVIARGGTFAPERTRAASTPTVHPSPAPPTKRAFPWRVAIPVAMLSGLAAVFFFFAERRFVSEAPSHVPAASDSAPAAIPSNSTSVVVVSNAVSDKAASDRATPAQAETPARPRAPIDPTTLNDSDATRRTQKAFDALFPGWTVSAVEQTTEAWAAGYQKHQRGRKDVVTTGTVSMETPCVISRELKLDMQHPLLVIEVASCAHDCDFMLSVRVNGRKALKPRLVCTPDVSPYERILVPLSKWRGTDALIEIVHDSNNRYFEFAFWSRIEIVEGTGEELAGPVGIESHRALVRAGNPKRSDWVYSESEPQGDWKALSFDDSAWQRTNKALGRGKGVAPELFDLWRSNRLWVRRKFKWRSTQSVYKAFFDLFADQDAEIYLNGRLVFEQHGWNGTWVPHAAYTKAFAEALREGENVLSATILGDGGSFFDTGLTIETWNRDMAPWRAERRALEERWNEDAFRWLTRPAQSSSQTRTLILMTSGNRADAARKGLKSCFGSDADSMSAALRENRHVEEMDLQPYDLLVLDSRNPKSRYSPQELAHMRRYMESGGNVMVLARNRDSAQGQLLWDFGLAVDARQSDEPLRVVCPGGLGETVSWRAQSRGYSLGANPLWRAMVVGGSDPCPDVIVAMRHYGRGRMFFVAPGVGESHFADADNRRWWSRIVRTCGRDRTVKTVAGPTGGELPVSPLAGWTLVSGRSNACVRLAKFRGEENVVRTHPPCRGKPLAFARTLKIDGKNPVLHVSMANHGKDRQFRLRVRINGRLVREKDITDGWTDVYVDLEKVRGKNARIELEHLPTGWWQEWAYWSTVEVVDDASLREVARFQADQPVVKLYDHLRLEGSVARKAVQRTCDVLFPGWKVSENGRPAEAGYEEEFAGRYNNLLTHPPREDVPVILSRSITLPRNAPALYLAVASHPDGDFELQVKVNGKIIAQPDVRGGQWQDLTYDLAAWAGRTVRLELLNMPTGWRQEWAHWNRIEIR